MTYLTNWPGDLEDTRSNPVLSESSEKILTALLFGTHDGNLEINYGYNSDVHYI